MNRGLAANINARVGPNDVLWCLGDWVFGGRDAVRNARWFRDQIQCRTVFLVWGNHDDRRIRDLFTATYDQVEIRVEGVKITLNHYPMLTWNGQHHGSVESPNIHLYGHVHALYDRDPSACPVRDASAWAALDVGLRRPRLPGLVARGGHGPPPASARGLRGTEARAAALRPLPGPRAPCRRRPGVKPVDGFATRFAARSVIEDQSPPSSSSSFLTSSVNSASPSRRVWSGSMVSALSPIRSAVPEESPSDRARESSDRATI